MENFKTGNLSLTLSLKNIDIFSLSPTFTILLSCQPRVTVTSCFVYKDIRDLESIDHLCINPIRRIGLIHKWYIDSHQLKWSVQVNVLLNHYKQNITLLSLLVGTTVSFKGIFFINFIFLDFILLLFSFFAIWFTIYDVLF